jgi:cytochrome oxidase Cu insertion factor (SCO1/SenC/PrrC family)
MPAVLLVLLFIGVLPVFIAGPAAAADDAGSIWGAGYFPNVLLTTSEGKQVRFFDDLIKGKVVVINFLYTSCPDVCPLETARLREVQELLGDRVGRDVFMYSISIDPERDTPEVLKRYAERFEVGPGWLFLTGNKDDITQLRRKLGLYSDTPEGGKLEAHAVSSIIGNQSTGRWMKMSPFENPYIMATQVGSWLSNWKMPSNKEQDYAKAPKLRTVSKGESIYRTRCEACHSIGVEGMVKTGKRSLGPDLLGVVAKRDRAWLTRWLAEPDKMIEEKDPLAMSLLAEFDNVAMPNLRLNETEIKAVIVYIEEASLRQGKPQEPPPPHHH